MSKLRTHYFYLYSLISRLLLCIYWRWTVSGNLWLRWETDEQHCEALITVPATVAEKLSARFSDAKTDWRSKRRLIWLAASLGSSIEKLAEEPFPLVASNDIQLAWAYAKALNKKIPRDVMSDPRRLAQYIEQAEHVESDELVQYLASYDPTRPELLESVLE